MDYIVFVVEINGNIIHAGRIDGVRDYHEARRKILSHPAYANKNIFLVKADNFIKVQR